LSDANSLRRAVNMKRSRSRTAVCRAIYDARSGDSVNAEN
jgi:hypothetical protein